MFQMALYSLSRLLLLTLWALVKKISKVVPYIGSHLGHNPLTFREAFCGLGTIIVHVSMCNKPLISILPM